MRFSTSTCLTLTLATCFALATDAPGQLLDRPALDPPGHLERPDQPPMRFIGPRQVSPPPSCEFLTVNGFTSVRVNVDEDGNNILDDAANEPTIAINPLDPDNMVIGWRQFDTIESNFRQSGVASSHDGGMTWTNRGPLQAGPFAIATILARIGSPASATPRSPPLGRDRWGQQTALSTAQSCNFILDPTPLPVVSLTRNAMFG